MSRAVACDPRPSPNSDDSGTKPQSALSATSGRPAPAVGRDGARGRRRRSPLTCRRRRAAGSCPGPGCHSFPVLSTRSRTPGAQAQCARVTRGHSAERAPRGGDTSHDTRRRPRPPDAPARGCLGCWQQEEPLARWGACCLSPRSEGYKEQFKGPAKKFPTAAETPQNVPTPPSSQGGPVTPLWP